jgi:predicted double-glycine peptidase
MSYIRALAIAFLSCALPIYALPANNFSVSPDRGNQIAHFYELKSADHLTMLNMKGYQQTTDYTCGPATIMSILHYYGILKDNQMNHETELKIAKEMGTTAKTGTRPEQIVTWLKQHGFDVKTGKNGTIEMLQDNAKKGIPTLVEWIDWGGHWAAVSGYNSVGKTFAEDKDTIFFADPAAHFDNTKVMNGMTAMNPDRFFNMWFDAQLFNPGHIIKGIYITAVPKKQIQQS